ncbi:MAG: 23S rRNA (pseudouridine(1915)-N(3))-methyltransferase RlmH, partial [Proteiniphilum sp.]
MKVVLLSVGETDNEYFARIIEDYKKRVNFYLPFELSFVPDVKNRKNLSINEFKEEEGKKLLAVLHATDQVVLLDDKGKQV